MLPNTKKKDGTKITEDTFLLSAARLMRMEQGKIQGLTSGLKSYTLSISQGSESFLAHLQNFLDGIGRAQ